MKKRNIFLIVVVIAIISVIVFFIYDYNYIQSTTFDIDSLIDINNEQDIFNKRNSLIDFIWTGKEFPHGKIPDIIENNILDPKYNDLSNLKQINKFEIIMDYKINSIAYHFIPVESNNVLIIYHQGHLGDFINGKKTIQFFLNEGYSVIAFSMPLMGMNEQPIIVLSNSNSKQFQSHDQLHLLESDNLSPIKFFVEPIALTLNYFDEKYDYNSYNMIGISGGGWVTVLYSAIDDRILESYSVAGSYPLFLRDTRDIGDYEQKIPELYQIANYLELYILSSYGDNRKLIQIFNEKDPCCFSGKKISTYQDNIIKKLNKLGNGTFDIVLDDTHEEHKISEHALNIIHDMMN